MDIYKYLGKSFVCEFCGGLHTSPVKAIEKRTIKELPSFVSSLLPEVKSTSLIADNIVWEVMGERCKKALETCFDVISHTIYPIKEKRVTARQEYIEGILSACHKADAIITAGTGTITDLGKYAGDLLKKPVISLPTAPSMNAYTSGVAALIKCGVKLTFPVKPVEGVFIDESILSESPIELIQAGFADSSAKSCANADWKLSSIITGENFCGLPLRIVNEVEKRYIDKGELLLRRDRETLGWLMEGLNLGGISMLIAGTSSPASGGEHLISHFLDMYTHQHKREPFAYHGLQVGTGIYISSVIYEYLRSFSSSEIKNRLQKRRTTNYEDKLRQIKETFPSSADIIEEELKKKIEIDIKIRDVLPERWDDIKRNVFPIVYKPDRVKKFLGMAGCPVNLKDIGVDKDLAMKVITLSRFIRGRLVVLDIADQSGLIEEIAEQVF
ncbi:MAG: iron-containing alcohol dehydrogenase [Candidatus Omnitrophica bacterium]|nr:iron-containing alcohol dehydrogenase [Candidatus Omnitrophota bacterium]